MSNVKKRIVLTTTRTDYILNENDCPLNNVETLEELKDKLIDDCTNKGVCTIQSFQNKSSSITRRQIYINTNQIVAIDLVIDSLQS